LAGIKSKEVKIMGENFSMLRCPNCGEAIEIRISKSNRKSASIEEVKDVLQEWIDRVDITESEDSIVVTPNSYLGKGLWYEINEALKTFDAEWVSAGKESRWIIKS